MVAAAHQRTTAYISKTKLTRDLGELIKFTWVPVALHRDMGVERQIQFVDREILLKGPLITIFVGSLVGSTE